VRRTVPLSSDCGCSARADRTRQLCERDRNGAGTCSSLPRLSLGIPSTASLQSAGASAFAASPSRSTRRPAAASSSSTSLGPWRSSNATSSGSAPRQGSPRHGRGADRAADPRRWMNARRRLPGCSTPTRPTRLRTSAGPCASPGRRCTATSRPDLTVVGRGHRRPVRHPRTRSDLVS
jgi:hypothetical protein